MKKQLTIIGIIGMLLAVGLSGCFEDNGKNNGSNITPLSGKVTATTNKIEYKQNETITINLYNGLNVSIYSMAVSAPSSFCIEHIEKKTSDGWASFMIRDKRYGDVVFEMCAPGEIKPGQMVSFECIPEIWLNETSNYSDIEPGVYRLEISYLIREDNLSENWTSYTVYSNEFYVEKEQIKEVIVTTNKIEYRQNETINITLYNGLNVSILHHRSISEVEKNISTGWKLFLTDDLNPNVYYDIYDPAIELKPYQSVSIDWKADHLWNWTNDTYEYCLAEPGSYRIKLSYYIENQTSYKTYTVYSNEFIIEEE